MREIRHSVKTLCEKWCGRRDSNPGRQRGRTAKEPPEDADR